MVDVVFVWPRNLGSFLTALGQGYVGLRPPQHVCLRFGDMIHTTGADRLLWYGQVNAQTYLAKRRHEVFRLDGISPLQAERLASESCSLFGTAYPWWDYLRLATGLLRNTDKPTRRNYCSKAVAACVYRATGIVLANGKPYSDVTPEELWWNVKTNQVFKRILQ